MNRLNESRYLDLSEWLSTLTELNVDTATGLPKVTAAVARVDRLYAAIGAHANSAPDIAATVSQLAYRAELDDPAAVVDIARKTAYAYDDAHRERVALILSRSVDEAMSAAIRAFRNSDHLEALRPAFDHLAPRLALAASTIPAAVRNLDDATRLGHADAYLQLEKDVAAWKLIHALIRAWMDAGILGGGDRRLPIEYMVDDLDAYSKARANSGAPARIAAGITAGSPRLHIPDGPTRAQADPQAARRVADAAQQADATERLSLGLRG
jgi:hypothetical protein